MLFDTLIINKKNYQYKSPTKNDNYSNQIIFYSEDNNYNTLNIYKYINFSFIYLCFRCHVIEGTMLNMS